MAGIVGKVLSNIQTTKSGVEVSEVKAEISKGENVQAELFPNPGIDSKPLPDDRIYLARRTESGAYVVLGFLDTKNVSITEKGEIRIYSRDEGGNVQASVYCMKDGVTVINENVDFAVRFNQLKIAFDQLKADFNTLVSLFNAHVHFDPPNVTIITGIPSVPGIPSAADIDPAKIENIKVP